MSEVTALLEPLFERAEREDLWFFCRYQQLWFSPKELRAAHADGRFLWGPVNWELRDPQERIDELSKQAGAAETELKDIVRRIQKS